jgi:hypothetical protein
VAVVFRDLCDELGYALEGHGVKLRSARKALLHSPKRFLIAVDSNSCCPVAQKTLPE